MGTTIKNTVGATGASQRSGSTWYVDEFGNLHAAPDGLQPLYGMGMAPEPQRTNLFDYSDDFENQWTVIGTPGFTGSQTDPSGGTNAVLVEDDNAGESEGVYENITVTPNTYYTFSAYIKEGDGTGTRLTTWDNSNSLTRYSQVFSWSGGVPSIGASTGTGLTHKIQSIGDGWYRVALTIKVLPGCISFGCYLMAGHATGASDTGTTYFYRAQLEAGTYPTSAIQTTGSSATRSAGYTVADGTTAAASRLLSAGRCLKSNPASTNKCQYGVNFDSAWLDGTGLHTPGTTLNYASTPDSAALSITGDLEIRVYFAPDSWSVGTKTILAKWAESGNQRSYWLHRTGANLRLRWSTDGTTVSVAEATVPTPNVTDGIGRWIKVTLDVDNGSGGNDVKFYESATDGAYSQIGSTITGGAPTSIFDGTAILEVGSYATGALPIAGTFYNVLVLDGIGGTVQFDADFTAEAAGTPGDDQNNVDTFTEDSANAATVTIVSKISGWTVGGDAAAIWTIVDDADELRTAGLHEITYDGRVLKCDNSGGAAISTLQNNGTCGSTNDQTVSGYARGSGDFEPYLSGASGTPSTVTASYVRYDQTLTPSGSGNNPRFSVSAGGTIYILLPQLEESPIATEVIPNATSASLTRNADDYETAFTDTYVAADGITVQIEFDPVDSDLDDITQQYLVLGDDKDSTMSLSFRRDDADYKAKLINDGATIYSLTFTESITAGQSNQITIRLDPSTNQLQAYVGDVAETPVSVTLPSDGESWASDEIMVGKTSYAKIFNVRVAHGVHTPAEMELLAIDPVG